MRLVTRTLLWTASAAVLVFATIVVGGAVNARQLPDLKPWHRLVPAAELRAADFGKDFTLDEYLRREAQVFDDVRQLEGEIAPEDRQAANRYFAGSRSSPRLATRDWNRTFELTPAGEWRGGALLLHGLTDGPYSMRAIAERLSRAGFYCLALRLPGHGAVPGGLTRATWRDWLAATSFGAAHVRGRIGAGRPLVVVGYSNGGALAVEHALQTLGGREAPDRIVLLSPMIGVTPFARLSSWISALAPIPYFEKAAWLDVLPEYNPFKFNSMPAHAGRQTFELTRQLAADFAAAGSGGRLAAFPPVLTFQSLVDSTVSTRAVVDTLYAGLGDRHELVLFDINRVAGLEPFIRPADATLFDQLFDRRAPRKYALTVVSNAGPETLDVAEWQVPPGQVAASRRLLGLSWPAGVFSLSHVAIPFPSDDPLYGSEVAQSASGLIQLGRLSPRGEKAVLTVPTDQLMRASCNPFFSYLADRTLEWVRR